VRIYLANLDPELLPVRAVAVLRSAGLSVAGNLLMPDGPSLADFAPDILFYVPTVRRDAIEAPKELLRRQPLVVWALYPDQMTGWDLRANTYRNTLRPAVRWLLEHATLVLTNSHFTRRLLERQLAGGEVGVCHLGIDTHGIRAAGRPTRRNEVASTVLWHHRWSVDKNFDDALRILLELARRHPDTTFILGRTEDWQPYYSPEDLKDRYRAVRSRLRSAANIRPAPRFDRQRDYWRFIGCADIAFSCSSHETFGLAMLEQAYAGAACVVPAEGVYNEVHEGALRVDRRGIAAAISTLIEQPDLWRRTVGASGRNAAGYDVGDVARRIAAISRAVLAC
jgi:glycosyltransferase involved in cell wall biosynthesis